MIYMYNQKARRLEEFNLGADRKFTLVTRDFYDPTFRV